MNISTDTTTINQTIKGYDLRDRIGAGGFGAVYRAYQSTVGREVAIKFILPGFANQPEFIRRFEAEAQVVARLEHPHITPLYDYWRDPDGAYLVMRYIRGGTLHSALQHGPYELQPAALLLDQIAGALSLAHRNGVIHRDIKPGNILLDEDGNAYLTDFGIAKDLNLPTSHTQQDAIVGSLDYISPEQARGEPVTPRTDIYSLGVTMFEVITGHHPFENISPIERLYKHINDPLPFITALEPALLDEINRVIQKATAKNPEKRYPDALAFAADFREAIGLNRASTAVVELLTIREQEILQLIIDGLSNKEIAARLTVTVGTVKWYVNQIYGKLGVRSRVQAIVRARELNLIVRPGEAIEPIAIPTEDFRPDNPYKGLRAFQAADYQDFYGREKVAAKLVRRLGEAGDYSRFLAVIGPSGGGKSSLVKAGVIPALWRGELPGSETWFVVEMLPGSRPLDELEIALTKIAANQSGNLREQLGRDKYGLARVANLILPDDGSELVLVIDQFEEVFTLLEDESARAHFLDLLYAAVTEPRSRVRVIVTLRADFYDRPLHYPQFGELVRNRLETIMPLSSEELEAAIARPAERVGVSFEPGLVAGIIGDVNYQPGALPLLQYALTELFERRTGRLLTREAYQAIGGTVGALAKRAEEVYQSLDRSGQETVRQLFLRLVTLGEGAEDTRRRTARSELLAIASDETQADVMDEIIDTFAAYRLLALDTDPGTRTPTVEVAHEALLREWERLRTWLNDSRDEIRLQRQLAAMAEEWKVAKQDASFLARGSRLEQFEAWTAQTGLALTARERAYLDASIVERGRQTAAETARQAREKTLERRSQTFLRGLVAVLLVATLGALALTALAINQSQVAQSERDTAQQAQATLSANFQHVDSLRLAAEANNMLSSNLGSGVDVATLLALRSLRYGYLSEGDAVLQKLMKNGFPIRTFKHPDPGTYAVGFSPDGQLIATGDEGGVLFLWDAASGEQLRPLVGHIDAVNTAQFSPDNKRLLTASSDGTARLWDVTSGEQIRQWDHPGIVGQASFSPDGSRIVTGGEDDTIRIWETHLTELLLEFPADHLFIGAVIFSPDGRSILSGGDDGSARLWDAATGKLRREYPGHTHWILPLDFNSDGSMILTGSEDRTARLWDAVTGEVLQTYTCSEPVHGVDFSADDQSVLIGCGRLAQIWDVTTKQLKRQYLNDTTVRVVTFSPDGQHFLASSQGFFVYLWETHPLEYPRLFASGLYTQDAAFSPDGRWLATASGAQTPEVVLWDFETGDVIWRYTQFNSQVTNVDFSPDGRTLAANSGNSAVLLDPETGAEIGRLVNEQGGELWGLDFSSDGRRLVAGSFTNNANRHAGVVIVWELTSQTVIWQSVGSDSSVVGAAFSPDGRYIATGSHDGFARLWDAATGKEIRRFRHPDTVYHVAFSHDGQYIATAGWDYIVRLWDAHTGEEVRQYIGHSSLIAGVVFSSDDQYLASGSSDGTARLWDVASGRLLRTYYGNDSITVGVTFSPDDEYVIAGGWGGGTRAWPRDVGPMVEFICSRLAHDFPVWGRQNFGIPDWEPTCPSNTNIIPEETTLESVYIQGNFQRAVGCIGNGVDDCEITRMHDDNGNGHFELTLTNIPIGTWGFVVSLNGRDVATYGLNGRNERYINFTVPAENTPVTFGYDSQTHAISVTVSE